MAKKEKKILTHNSAELDDFEKDERSYKRESMGLEIGERKTKLFFKKFFYGIAATFALITLWKYINNIPVPTEIVFGVPTFFGLTNDFPKNIYTFFRKPLP